MAADAAAAHARKKVAAMPRESELVAFGHSAAGHEGISSNASGSLVIKPCTQAEIDFYESAKDHILFQAHMPTFIGSLVQHEDQAAAAPVIDDALSGRPAASRPSPAADRADDPTPGLTKRPTWKPSGGKKLSTGLAIVLENAASGFKHPNVLDVKLGARLWDDDAPVSKRQKLDEVAARTTSGSLGFRVAGMKLWLGDEGAAAAAAAHAPEPHVELKDGYQSFTKLYGQAFTQDNVVDAFTTYLGGASRDGDRGTGKWTFTRPRAAFLSQRFVHELESLQYVMENEESRMYSASVLMIYEGDEAALEASIQKEQERSSKPKRAAAGDDDEVDEDDEEDESDDEGEEPVPDKVHVVRLIDFAHASWTPGQGPDENALQGIRSLLDIFRGLLS